MSTETEDSLARLCVRQGKLIKELTEERDTLIKAGRFALLNIKTMPAPKLGEVNWPMIAEDLEAALKPDADRTAALAIAKAL